MEIIAPSATDLPQIAESLLEFAEGEKIFLFEGEMAAGKTTFIKTLCLKLGVKESVSSPTYSIVNEYEGTSDRIYHFDFYRIKNEDEAFDIGFEEYVYSDAICLIEWPENVGNLLPDNFIKVNINIGENEARVFSFSKGKSALSQKL